jgi:hypothetical protein
MNQNCEDCKRLWRAYATATTEYASMDKHLNAAAANGTLGVVSSLVPKLEALEKAKVAAREAVRQHEAETGHR